jgi:hypothetical protein
MQMIGINIETRGCEIFYMRDVKDVARMTTYKSKSSLVYITSYGIFTLVETLEEASLAYKQFGFKPYDKSHLVNERKVRAKIKEPFGTRIVFDDGSEINVASKSRKR